MKLITHGEFKVIRHWPQATCSDEISDEELLSASQEFNVKKIVSLQFLDRENIAFFFEDGSLIEYLLYRDEYCPD